MSDLTSLTLKGALDGLASKAFTAEDIAHAHLIAIEAANPHLNAYVLQTPDKAIDMAKASDARRASGEAGPLEGISLGIKDLFCTEGVQATAGSNILKGFIPPYESTVTANLWRDGAVMLGKLNMDEFAMGSSNETSAFGPVTNPWRAEGSNQALTPGGSSGGSAAAVAAGLCLGATATDTGGSIRQPRRLHRHRGDQADLWPLLALGRRRLRLLARPSRAHRQDGRGCRHPAHLDERARSEGLHQPQRRGSRFRLLRRQIGGKGCGSVCRRNTGSTGCRPRSPGFGTRAWIG